MTNLKEIYEKLSSPGYNFLKTNERLGNNIILLGLGGSYAYGTQREDGTSDTDIRGIALNSKSDLIGLTNFENFINEETDTVIYSFNKIIKLLMKMNPNICEILGLKPEHYLYVHPIGQELLDNKNIFLSKNAVKSFGGYANAQLHKLQRPLNELAQHNREAVIHNKLGKHMSHLVRLYFMCFDILERGEIITYREAEHDLLMDIRNGKYLDNNNQPTPEFFEFVDELEKRMNYAKENTLLPEKPDYNTIQDFVMSVNERVVKDEV